MKLRFLSHVTTAKSVLKDSPETISASLAELKKHIPEIDEEKNPDLLPVSFNAFVANKGNKNYDILDTKGTMDIVDSFIHKPINIEHNQERTIGVITNYSFSEYGTNKEISKDVASKMEKPFNVVLGGLVWKNVNEKMAEAIEESSKTDSEDYGSVSASWELSFEDYDIVATENGSSDISDGIVIRGEERSSYDSDMKHMGGSGKSKRESWSLYRMPTEKMVALGIGFVANPAADVSGVCTKHTQSEKIESSETSFITKEHLENFEKKYREIVEIKEKFSKMQENNVLHKEKVMIERIKDITADSIRASLGEDKVDTSIASALSEIIKTAWNKESGEFETKLNEEKSAKEAAEAKAQEVQDKLETSVEKVSSLEKEVQELKAKEIQREKEEKFQSRMDYFDTKFDISDKQRPIIAKKLNQIESDEQFDEVKSELETFLSVKEEKPAQDSKASVEGSEEEGSVDDVIDEAKKETKSAIANTKSEATHQEYSNPFVIGETVRIGK